jgi:AraC-like DNA-binding protein
MKGVQTLVASPGPALGAHVEMFWAQTALDRPAGPEQVLPSGTVELVIDLLDPRQPPIVCGPHTRPFRMERRRRESYLGVHLRPGAAAPLLGLPGRELSGELAPLDAIWGRAALELRDRLQAAPGFAAQARILDATLRARLERAREPHPAVRYALAELTRTATPIGRLGSSTGLSARRLIELFDSHVGLTPKLFARVRRFQRVLAAASERATVAWADLALRCGYCDQAHLHRDFRAFAELTPGAYLRQRSADPHHVPLDAR